MKCWFYPLIGESNRAVLSDKPRLAYSVIFLFFSQQPGLKGGGELLYIFLNKDSLSFFRYGQSIALSRYQ